MNAPDRLTLNESSPPSATKLVGLLDWLFEPLGVDTFLTDYWDRQPLYLQGGENKFSKLAEPGRLRDLVLTGAPWQFRRLPELYKDGVFMPHEEFVQEYVDMDGRRAFKPRLERICEAMAAGATANCFGLEPHFPQLQELRAKFAQAFMAEVEVSLFLSQKDHPGLAPHYDCVEIFVLQIHGSKKWYVSSQRVENPLVGFGGATAYDLNALHAEIVLEPGDMLYLPRGVFHHACATTRESLHTSIAVKLPTYVDLFSALGATASGVEDFRSYLPFGTDTASWLSAKTTFGEKLLRVTESESFQRAVASLLDGRSSAQSLASPRATEGM